MVSYAFEFLMASILGFAILTLVYVVRFTLQGMGYSGFAMAGGILEMAARMAAGFVLAPLMGFKGICIAHPLAWLAADCLLVPAFIKNSRRENDMEATWKPFIQQEKTEVQKRFVKWYDFMEKNVKFHMDDSELHTKYHCARVLLFTLKNAAEYGLNDEDTETLAWAAVFHDSRRQDDWLDVGHGQRAAGYYRDFCGKNGIMADERVYRIMAYHDRDDALGISRMKEGNLKNGVLLYRIFKDADALDRFRIAPDALDRKFLRTGAAKNMVMFAKNLVQQTQFAAQD